MDLQALFSGLDRDSGAAAPGKPAGRSKAKSFAGAKSRLRLPLEGTLVRRFGTAGGGSGASKGIVLAAHAAKAQVVAPYDGQVLFSGPFLEYGKLVILRHGEDFHTLLAGLTTLDVSVGDFLLEGEPIGAMGESGPGKRLYVELRKDNQPVDPEPWIQGLNKKH